MAGLLIVANLVASSDFVRYKETIERDGGYFSRMVEDKRNLTNLIDWAMMA